MIRRRYVTLRVSFFAGVCARKSHDGEVRACLEAKKAEVTAAFKAALDTLGGGRARKAWRRPSVFLFQHSIISINGIGPHHSIRVGAWGTGTSTCSTRYLVVGTHWPSNDDPFPHR